MPPACEIDKLVRVPDPLAPDMAQVEEDRLNAEAVELERLVRFNLVESAARLLDGDLARAGGPSEKIAVLTRWIARTQLAYAVTELIVAGRDRRAAERAVNPPSQQSGPHFISLGRNS